jgi:hypothetical protein
VADLRTLRRHAHWIGRCEPHTGQKVENQGHRNREDRPDLRTISYDQDDVTPFKVASAITRRALSIVLLVAFSAATACGGHQRDSLAAAATAKATRLGRGYARLAPFRFFSPSSFWNEALPANARLDPNSAEIVGAFAELIAKEAEKRKRPTINTTKWSVPIYTVPADQPTVKVTLDDASPALQLAWDAVPLPADAQPAAGTDKHLVVWQPSTDRLWEFWRMEQTPAGWRAGAGGAMQHVSSDTGTYGPEDWPGAEAWWGASGSSLSIAGGLITLEDLERGEINHALAIAIPEVREGAYALPAGRSDGQSTEPLALPEGAHLRLDPNLNLAALHLPRLTLMMAEAAQRYGIVVRDYAANVAFYGQDPLSIGTEPYADYFEGKSSQQLLASFPWSDLQLLKMELHPVRHQRRA